MRGKPAVAMFSSTFFFACARCSAVCDGLFESSSHLATIEIVALCVSRIVLLWNATLLSGSFQEVDDGGVQPRVRMLE